MSGILKRLAKIKNLAMNDPKAWNTSLWQLAGSISQSGEVVTEETALHYSAFWNGVTLIARTLGSLPLHLMRSDDRNKRIFTDLPLYYVMHTQWNPFMTAMIGRECMMAHILTHGNGYAEKVYNGYGELVELWPIPPTRIRTIEIKEDGNIWYEIDIPTKNPIWLPREKVLHVPGLGYDGFIGYSVVAMARKSLGLSMAMETFASKYFGDGTHPTGIVTHKNQLKNPKLMRDALQETYGGLGKSHRLMLLEEGMEYKSLALNAEDAQFLQSRTFQIPEVARWLNLPPHKLKDLTKSSFNNIEAENTSFVVDSLLPWIVCIEQNYNIQLLTKNQHRKQNLYFKHIVEGLLRGNTKDRAEFYKSMFSNGMTMNQILEKEDMNPINHPFADVPWVSMNMIPLTMVEEYINKITENKKNMENQDEDIEQKSKNQKLIKLNK